MDFDEDNPYDNLGEFFKKLQKDMSKFFAENNIDIDSIMKAFGDNISDLNSIGFGMSIGPDGIKNIPPEILEKMKNMGFPTGNMDFGNTNTNTVQEPYTEVNYDQYTNSYHIIADMPGIEENQVSISIDENEITISGNNGEMKYKKNLLVKHNLNKKSIDYKVRNGTLEIFVKAK